MFMTDHLDRHHVFYQQSPFASNNEAWQQMRAYHPNYMIDATFYGEGIIY